MSRATHLALEPVDASDTEHIDAVFDMHSRLDVVRWLDLPPWHPMDERDEARDWLAHRARFRDADDLQRQCMVRDSETGEIVGRVGVGFLVRQEEGFRGEYGLGWTLRPSARGRGIATRAARMLAEEVFADGLAELQIEMWEDNEPSARVARRLGADELGVLPDPWYGGRARMFVLRPEHLTEGAHGSRD